MSARSKGYKKKRRTELFEEQKGACYWCAKPMVLLDPYPDHGRMKPNVCTLDHLFDRSNPARQTVTFDIPRYVAACFRCNQDRGKYTCKLVARASESMGALA